MFTFNPSRLIYILIFSFGLMACPRPPETRYESKPLIAEPNNQDIELDLSKPGPTVVMPVGTSDSSQFFQFIQDLDLLGSELSKPILRDTARTLLRQFYLKNSTHSSSTFGNSPYADLLISRAKPEFMKATAGLSAFMSQQRLIIDDTLTKTDARFGVPTQALNITDAISKLAEYFNLLEEQLNISPLDSSVKSEIIYALYEKFWLKLPSAKMLARQLNQSESFSHSIQVLRDMVSALDVELDPNSEKRINIAQDISGMLNQNLTPKTAFVLLITLWDNMTDAERKESFGQMSPELYDYLKGKNRKFIDCNKKNECQGFIDKFIKKHIILPEIKGYGVDKLRAQINASAAEHLHAQTGEIATEFVKELPALIKKQIYAGLEQEENRYASIRADFEPYIRRQIQKWFENEFNITDLPALENRSIEILRDKESFVINGRMNSTGAMETSSDTLGSALMASTRILEQCCNQDTEQMKILLLQRMNQLLAHGGFNLSDGSSFKSLGRSWRSSKSPQLNIEKVMGKTSLITMPSPVTILSGYSIPDGPLTKNFKVSEQAQLLDGFSELMAVFRDWEKSPAEVLIQKYTVKNLLKEIPSEELNQPAFPKEAFLAVALGNVSAVLNNLRSNGTPLFLQCESGGVVWQDTSKSCPVSTSLAGLIEIKNGVRQSTVNTQDLAQFLRATIRFIQVAESSLKTQSDYLLKPQSAGELSPRDQLRDAIPEIRKLAIGLTNYITHILEKPDGEFVAQTQVGEAPEQKTKNNLRTQLLALHAVTLSAKYFNLKPYKSSALSAYYFLNSTYWNEKSQFYSANESVKAEDLARTLIVLKEVQDLVTDAVAKSQIRGVLLKYSEALEKSSSDYLVKNL